MTSLSGSMQVHHSPAFPSISTNPQALGAFWPQGCVLSSAFSQYQATLSSSASQMGDLASPPARQAYSHSASVGSRYFLPVSFESQRQYSAAAPYVIERAG